MKVFEIHNIQEFITAISKEKHNIIAVDGDTGVQKSTHFAPLIAKAMNARVISLDDYLDERVENGELLGMYLIDKEKLKKDLEIRLAKGKVVIEGILVTTILERIGYTHYIHVYIEPEHIRMSWDKLHGAFASKNFTEIVSLIEKNMQLIKPSSKVTGMRWQVLNYHFEKRPFENADYKIIVKDERSFDQ